MTTWHGLAFRLSSVFLLGAAGLGASGCTVSATLTPSGCSADSTVACVSGSGYTCSADSQPSDTDPTLLCSYGTYNGDGTVSYCCGASSPTYICNADPSLLCSGGAIGETCLGGAQPDSSSQTCSVGTTMADGSVGYCCAPFTYTANTCAADPSVTGCQYPSYGFSCAAGDNPMAYNASLVCSTPTSLGGQDVFCCTDGTTTTDSCAQDPSINCSASPGAAGYSCTGQAIPSDTDSTIVCSGGTTMPDGSVGYCCASAGSGTFGCQPDSTLACSGGATGQTCTGGATPDTTSESCSIPTTNPDGSDGYCCVAFAATASTCAPDNTVTGCLYPSYGFSCASGDNPTTYDPSLTCSAPAPSGSEDLFCCQ